MEFNFDKCLIELGIHLKALRTAQAWRQQDVAEKAGITREHVGYIEKARSDIKFETLVNLASVFSREVCELFGRAATEASFKHLPIAERVIIEKQQLPAHILRLCELYEMDSVVLSELTGIRHSDVVKYMSDKKNMQLGTIFKFAVALGVDVGVLFDYKAD